MCVCRFHFNTLKMYNMMSVNCTLVLIPWTVCDYYEAFKVEEKSQRVLFSLNNVITAISGFYPNNDSKPQKVLVLEAEGKRNPRCKKL